MRYFKELFGRAIIRVTESDNDGWFIVVLILLIPALVVGYVPAYLTFWFPPGKRSGNESLYISFWIRAAVIGLVMWTVLFVLLLVFFW